MIDGPAGTIGPGVLVFVFVSHCYPGTIVEVAVVIVCNSTEERVDGFDYVEIVLGLCC